MKKLILLFGILVVSTAPAFAAFGYYEGINVDKNIHYYDNSEYDAYCNKLEDDFIKKYWRVDKVRLPNGKIVDQHYCIAPVGAYEVEVEYPQLEALRYFRDGAMPSGFTIPE